MSNYAKKITSILMIASLFAAVPVSAQNKTKSTYPKGFRIGFGINGGVSTNSDYDGAIGADVRLQYDLNPKASFTLTSGFNHLFNSYDGDKGIVPIKAGFKHFMNKSIYALGEVGAGIGTHSQQGNTLIWSPSVGYANSYIDISLRYERYQDYNTDQLGIRIAYGISLKNYNKKK